MGAVEDEDVIGVGVGVGVSVGLIGPPEVLLLLPPLCFKIFSSTRAARIRLVKLSQRIGSSGVCSLAVGFCSELFESKVFPFAEVVRSSFLRGA